MSNAPVAARKYTDAQVREMIRLQFPRPAEVPPFRWKALRPFKPKITNICYLAANGLPWQQISENLSLSEWRVRLVLGNQRVAKQIGKIRSIMAGESPMSRYRKILNTAIDVQESIMLDPKQKGSTRLAASLAFQDRVLGKAVQQVDVNDVSLKKVYEMLSEERKKGGLGASESEWDSIYEDADLIVEQKKAEAVTVGQSAVDNPEKWIEENL